MVARFKMYSSIPFRVVNTQLNSKDWDASLADRVLKFTPRDEAAPGLQALREGADTAKGPVIAVVGYGMPYVEQQIQAFMRQVYGLSETEVSLVGESSFYTSIMIPELIEAHVNRFGGTKIKTEGMSMVQYPHNIEQEVLEKMLRRYDKVRI